MQELEFRHALRDEMSSLTQPPPMAETEVLDAAKHALSRRRAAWASAGSVAAVVALVTGVAFTASGDDRSGPNAGAEITSGVEKTDTAPNWPDGQPDATARSGPRYDQGVTLLNRLLEAAPPGYDTPANDLRQHEATVHMNEGKQWWSYWATAPIDKDGGVGELSATVTTRGNDGPAAQGCDLALANGEIPGTECHEEWVAGKPVGVLTGAHNLAYYRHADGTTVVIGQNLGNTSSGHPPLTTLPMTSRQLAELATDPGFHLD